MYNDPSMKPAAWTAVNGDSYTKPRGPPTHTHSLFPLVIGLLLLLSTRSRRPRVAHSRSAGIAGGLKAPAEEAHPTDPRNSTPGKVYLQLLWTT